MCTTLKFKITGKVKAKQSVKFCNNGIKYTPKDMVEYANWVRMCFKESYPNHLPHYLDKCYLQIEIFAYFKVPQSFGKKKREQALEGLIRPTVKPDWDNISKNICDALNGTAYNDDKAIVYGIVHKYYAENDYAEVRITAKEQEF